VGVERHDQPGGGQARPDAEIQLVATHHPPEKKIEPFAGASRRWAREEVADAKCATYVVSAFRRTAALALRRPVRGREIELQGASRKAVERDRDVGRGWIVAFEKKSLDRARPVDHLLQDPQQRDDVRGANPAVYQSGKRVALPGGIERAHVSRRAIADDGQQPLDRLDDAGHPPEGERRRAKTHHLAIVGSREAPDDLNRIRRRIGVVELGVQPVQGAFQERFVFVGFVIFVVHER